MTNSEKDELAAEIGMTLPISEAMYDEIARYAPNTDATKKSNIM